MAGTCQFSLGSSSGGAAWDYDGSSLVITPDAGAPLTLPVKEIRGISGDDYTLRVIMPDVDGTEELVLSHLGHDGPTIGESLRRDWLNQRTEVLRLTGTGESWLVRGQVAGLGGQVDASTDPPESRGSPEPFRGYVFEDLIVVAREGRDLEPLFLPLIEGVLFDEGSYATDVDEWPGRRITFSKLAKQTDEFVDRLTKARAMLARESEATLTTAVPGLPLGGRSSLAGLWMPGRLMELSRMENLCPGFEREFRTSWLTNEPRQEEARHLLEQATQANTWLGCTREDGALPAAESQRADEEVAARPLWMLAGLRDKWFLESLSMEDHATYCFRGGGEVPGLVSRLLCAPQFSKEALYSPLGELVGEKAELAIPAAHLGFLLRLRERFVGRVIHSGFDTWRGEVEVLVQGK